MLSQKHGGIDAAKTKAIIHRHLGLKIQIGLARCLESKLGARTI